MANAREILDRMKSIQDTMKITNAEKGKGKSG